MSATSQTRKQFETFAEFYPYYLNEHANPICRRLHFVGAWLVIAVIVTSIAEGNLALLWLIPVVGYGFAWVGHFFYEKNRPATFRHPLYSLLGDWVMFKDILFGKVSLSRHD